MIKKTRIVEMARYASNRPARIPSSPFARMNFEKSRNTIPKLAQPLSFSWICRTREKFTTRENFGSLFIDLLALLERRDTRVSKRYDEKTMLRVRIVIRNTYKDGEIRPRRTGVLNVQQFVRVSVKLTNSVPSL